MRNRILTNAFRNIRKSFPRFLSLMIMSMLGVFAFSGLQATAPDMMDTLNSYLADHNTYDVKIISTLGLTDDDIEALEDIKGVEKVEACYSKDTVTTIGDKEYVINVSSLPGEINSVDCLAGKLPEKSDQIVIEENMASANKLEIGDTITLEDDLFKEKTVTITGLVDSALYFNTTTANGGRGSTSIGNGTINYYTFCPASNFDQDYYSAIYCRVENIDQFTTGSQNYTDAVDQVVDAIKDIKESRQQARYDSVIEEGREEIEDQKTSAYKELDEAKSELDQAQQKLADAKKTLDDSYNTLTDAGEELASAKTQLDDGKSLLESSKAKLDSSQAQLTSAAKTLSDSRSQLDSAKSQLDSAKAELDQNKGTLDQALTQLQDTRQQLDAAQAQIDAAKAQVEEQAGMSLDNIKSSYLQLDAAISDCQNLLDQLQNLDSYRATAAALEEKATTEGLTEEEQATLVNLQATIAELSQYDLGTVQGQLDGFQNQKNALQTAYDTALQIQDQQSQVDSGNQTYEQKKAEYDQGNTSYQQGLDQYNSKYAEYQSREQTYQTGLAQYQSGKATFDAGVEEYNDGVASYNSSLATYQEKMKEYDSGWEEYESGMEEYDSGCEEYQTNLQDYQDAKQDVDDQIADAYEELDQIEMPKWYIYDRTNYSTYNDYIDDTSSVSNLAAIFPVVFFAVAILVSLISMNRMVEDDRLEIGTMKSLGFSNGDILTKYLIFSLLATICGGILGATFGITYLPYMISSIYKILFDLPSLHYLPNIFTTVVGILISIICVCGTSVYTVLKELREKPSELMRPKAPKGGKRILLENTFLWKRLKFSQKTICRNIFRYKKRVLVTILGIAGCTALMLCGFGIKDSIVDIPETQYGQIFTYDGYSYINGDGTVSDDMDSGNASDEINNADRKSVDDVEGNKVSAKANNADYKDVDDKDVAEIGSDVKAVDTSGKDIENEDDLDQIFTCDEITSFTKVDSVTATLDSTNITLLVAEDSDSLADMVNLIDSTTGEIDQLKDGQMIITEKIASLKGLKVGDTVELIDMNNKSYQLQISDIVDNHVDHYAFIDADTFAEIGGQFACNTVFFHTRDDVDQKSLTTKLLSHDQIVNVTYTSKLIERVGDMLKSLNKVVWILIILSALLSFVVLYNLSNINISERKREIATLKVLGFYDREVDNYITRENIILTIIGILIGLVLGFFLTRIVVGTIEIERCRFIYQIRLVSYVYSAVMSFCFTLIVNFVTHFSLKRIDMIESLKSVE